MLILVDSKTMCIRVNIYTLYSAISYGKRHTKLYAYQRISASRVYTPVREKTRAFSGFAPPEALFFYAHFQFFSDLARENLNQSLSFFAQANQMQRQQSQGLKR